VSTHRRRNEGEAYINGRPKLTLDVLAQRLVAGTARGGGAVIPDYHLETILAMPLDQFAREGPLLEVRVPWLDVTLWFVPEERDASMLGREGVNRGRAWTTRELFGVRATAGTRREALQMITLVKLTVDGDVAEIRRSGR
jgi:hypothetical protein